MSQLSEPAKLARNSYMREYRKLNPLYAEKQKECSRIWKMQNSEKIKIYINTYWEKKANKNSTS